MLWHVTILVGPTFLQVRATFVNIFLVNHVQVSILTSNENVNINVKWYICGVMKVLPWRDGIPLKSFGLNIVILQYPKNIIKGETQTHKKCGEKEYCKFKLGLNTSNIFAVIYHLTCKLIFIYLLTKRIGIEAGTASI